MWTLLGFLILILIFWSFASAILIVVGAVGFLESGQPIFIVPLVIGIGMAFLVD